MGWCWRYHIELWNQFDFYFIKNINPDTRIGVSNLKDNIEKVTIAKSAKNVKDVIYDMPSNLNIIIYKGEFHGGYSSHLLRDVLAGPT